MWLEHFGVGGSQVLVDFSILPRFHLGVAQKERARVTRVLVFGAIYQSAILVRLFEPQPFGPIPIFEPRQWCVTPHLV